MFDYAKGLCFGDMDNKLNTMLLMDLVENIIREVEKCDGDYKCTTYEIEDILNGKV
jgi:hypothetical protein